MTRARLTDEEREASKERRKARRREYYKENKERILAYNNAYRKAHPEKRKQYDKTATAKKKKSGYARKYYLENKERCQAQIAAWRQAHPEKVKEYNRRAQQRIKQRTQAERQKSKVAKVDLEKAKILFRDPTAAAHFQWLLDHSKNVVRKA